MAASFYEEGERALVSKDDLNWLSVRFDINKFHSENLLDVIVVLIIIFLIGFVLGYLCAIRYLGRAMTTTRIPQTRTSSRTLGTQSQCTYKRNWTKPRFYVLPQLSDGVFIETFKRADDDDD